MLKKKTAKKTSQATQKKSNVATRTLASWIWRTPIKFATLVLCLSIFISLIYGALATALDWSMSGKTVAILATIINLFGIYKLVKWLRTDLFDRRSSVAVLTSSAIAACFAMALFAAIFMLVAPVLWNTYAVSNTKLIFGLIGVLMIALIATYIMGLGVVIMYACYLRGIGLGMSRIKALLTLPFCVMWVPGYIMNDAKKLDSRVEIRSRTFTTLTDWIVAHPRNSYIALALLCITELLCLWGGGVLWNLTVVLTPVVLFFIWRGIVGKEHLQKTINKTFATIAVIINIMILAYMLGTATTVQPTQPNMDVIDITDTIQPITE